MVPVITYSLRAGAASSDLYHETISAFSRAVIAEGEIRCSPLVNALQGYLERTKREAPRSTGEYLYELLVLGVLWRCHFAAALQLSPLSGNLLTHLAELRERSARLKSSADRLRGVLGTLFLESDADSETAHPVLTLESLDRLLRWLAATGNFNEEVERFGLWRGCWAEQAAQTVANNLSAVLGLAEWFEMRSMETLGKYTTEVERFLADEYTHYRWRADRIFCGRRRVEYHLGMVGTEIMNRALRPAFERTARKIVLVPPCMRFQPETKCKAQASPYGETCGHCTPQCPVHQVTKLGEKHGFAVFILPEELRVFSGSAGNGREQTGIVGVSCVLTNAPGGWETKRLGIPAQGVPLDYCGCHWHWHKTGIPTNLNLNQLLRVLGLQQMD